MQVADLEGQISTLEAERSSLQSELVSSLEELVVARDDVKKFSETVTDTQNLYQHELMQHGKSMETLLATKEQVHCTYVGCRLGGAMRDCLLGISPSPYVQEAL